MQKSKRATFAQPSCVGIKASDFNHWLLKAPELGQPPLHTTSSSWPSNGSQGRKKCSCLPSTALQELCITAHRFRGRVVLRRRRTRQLWGTLTLPDRLLPCFWLLILDASFVPLHVHEHLRPSRSLSLRDRSPLDCPCFDHCLMNCWLSFFHALQWTAPEVGFNEVFPLYSR